MLPARGLAELRPLQRRDLIELSLREDQESLRAGRAEAVAVVAAASDGACIVIPALPDDLSEPRRARLAAAAAAALADAAGLGQPQHGGDIVLEAATWRSYVCVRVAAPEPAIVAALAAEVSLPDHAADLDRIRLQAVLAEPRDLDASEPLRAPWLWQAEMAARLGGRPADARLGPETQAALDLLASTRPRDADLEDETVDAHRDPVPRRRVVRRILRRLDGMGKYGGYHTEFRHLARGFAGDERALALEAGEVLVRAGLLDEKPSVGQRHVSLVAARTAEIHALVERGECSDVVLTAWFAER